MIQHTRFVIAVQDLEASAAFYRDVLGFSIREFGDPGWRLFVRDGCEIMAGECPDSVSARETDVHSYFAYLVVEDARALHTKVTGAGGEIVKALADEPWGMREFGLRTVDGHRIMIGQKL
jgi:predicted enzyme related to lactoylglutathione lyase